jgi:hypothetical protein
MKSQKELMGLALISDSLISVEPEGFFAPCSRKCLPFSSLPHSLPACDPLIGIKATDSKPTNTLFKKV